jgi:formate hydrogenlyase transcriptional activator
MYCVPLKARNRVIGALVFGSHSEGAFASKEDMVFLEQVGIQVAIAMDNAFAYQEIEALKNGLEGKNIYLEEEMSGDFLQAGIIGESLETRKLLKQIRTVARLDASVLLMGETGTGKELVARAIQRLSTRQNRSFIRVNCAVIPPNLVESELFGHERGSFTGAVAQKMGRVELAQGGTLFLDEIGELPLELQPKLLRVIQEREFERVGGRQPIKVDFRLIAATNRDLGRMVAEGTFRSDLFYRLNVFPIRVPSLRERIGDIPLLASHFVQKHAIRMGRKIESIPAKAMAALVAWPWPGNIRELENMIERSVILTEGRALQVPLQELRLPNAPQQQEKLADAEREAILRALRESGGRVSGPKGAATRLGVPRTTLQARMKQLGIHPKSD